MIRNSWGSTWGAEPASLNDAKVTAAYIAAVDAYLKAAQKYIDASGNDVNFIIKERNATIESAIQVIANYNVFFKLTRKNKHASDKRKD